MLSKGHAAPVLYAALAEKGYFPRKDIFGLVNWAVLCRASRHAENSRVEASTGSLGQGVSWAVGMAQSARIDQKAFRVYTLLGDGELQEGMVWEALMAAAHYGLDNLVAIVDHNGLQIDGRICDVLSPEPIADKFRAFGWETLVVDGHAVPDLMRALNTARETKGKPTAIVAKTVKGKGCSFMENRAEWHGKAPTAEEAAKALAELE